MCPNCIFCIPCNLRFEIELHLWWKTPVLIKGSTVLGIQLSSHFHYSKTCLRGTIWQEDTYTLWSGDIFSKRRPLKLPILRNPCWRDTCPVGTLSREYCGVPWRQVSLFRVKRSHNYHHYVYLWGVQGIYMKTYASIILGLCYWSTCQQKITTLIYVSHSYQLFVSFFILKLDWSAHSRWQNKFGKH